jgi:hypothetical protein
MTHCGWISENDIKSVDDNQTFNFDEYYEQCDIKTCELNVYCSQFNTCDRAQKIYET